MPHKDPQARREYMKARYYKIQADDPEKWAKLQAKHKRAYEKKLAQGEDAKKKIAADYKRWYDAHGKENARARKGNESWEDYQARMEVQRKKHRERMSAWNKTEAGQRARTRRSIDRRCGLDIDEYDATYDQQEGKCKICGVHGERYGKGRLVVDHCHLSNRFRALLCSNCNCAVGLVQESEEIVLKVLDYLRTWKAV